MSYTIKIGEAILENDYGLIRAAVRSEKLPDAPAFPGDPLSQHVNSRAPSYVGWRTFTQRIGLEFEALFMRELMPNHPSVVPLAQAHLDQIRGTIDRYRTKHPKAKPGWCECAKCDGAEQVSRHVALAHEEDLDGDLARLLWLEFWMGWALKHCAIPALENF